MKQNKSQMTLFIVPWMMDEQRAMFMSLLQYALRYKVPMSPSSGDRRELQEVTTTKRYRVYTK